MTVPDIKSIVQDLIAEVNTWDGVDPTPHRFGGTEFQIETVEMGHIHDFGLIDIPFTRVIRQRLVDEGWALPHHILPDSGWISFRLRSEGDKTQGLWLFRLAYVNTLLNSLRKHKSPDDRLPTSEHIAAMIANLPMSGQLRDLFNPRLTRYTEQENDSV